MRLFFDLIRAGYVYNLKNKFGLKPLQNQDATDLKVDRNGGDENVVVSIAKHEMVSPCVMDMEPTDDKRFDTVLIKTSYKYGLFGSNGENDLFIRGDGKPMVTR